MTSRRIEPKNDGTSWDPRTFTHGGDCWLVSVGTRRRDEAVPGAFGGFWTDDYPSLELRFQRDDGKTIEQVFRLSTRAQQSFMLPWQVYDGTNETASGNADISRAVVRMLPPGFLNQDRLKGDMFQLVVSHFSQLPKVHDFLKQTSREATLGGETRRAGAQVFPSPGKLETELDHCESRALVLRMLFHSS